MAEQLHAQLPLAKVELVANALGGSVNASVAADEQAAVGAFVGMLRTVLSNRLAIQPTTASADQQHLARGILTRLQWVRSIGHAITQRQLRSPTAAPNGGRAPDASALAATMSDHSLTQGLSLVHAILQSEEAVEGLLEEMNKIAAGSQPAAAVCSGQSSMGQASTSGSALSPRACATPEATAIATGFGEEFGA